MAGASKKTLKSGLRRAWYNDWSGKRVFFTQRGGWKEVNALADTLEAQHRERRLKGTAPKSSDLFRTFEEVTDEYLSWGAAEGGHGGRPWSTVHLAMRTRHLKRFWPDRIHPETLADVTLPKVETVSRALLAAKKTGKTVQTHVESIKALCLWAKSRGYIEGNPLEYMAPFDVTVKDPRMALTEGELQKLLTAAPEDRRILYQVATCTGYRKGELTALRVKDLDEVRCTLPLAAEFCKGRRDSRQPIPAALVALLKTLSEGKKPEAALLHVDYHIDRLHAGNRIRRNHDGSAKTYATHGPQIDGKHLQSCTAAQTAIRSGSSRK